MKLKNSLFIKLTASILLVFMLAATGAGIFGILYLVSRVDVMADSYLDAGYCQTTLDNKVVMIDTYYALKLRQEDTDSTQYDITSYETELGVTGESNFVWQLYDDGGTLLLGNIGEEEKLTSLLGSHQPRRQDVYRFTDTNPTRRETLHVVYGLREGLPYKDIFYHQSQLFVRLQKLLAPVIIATVAAVLFGIVLFSFLVAAAGRKEGTDKIALNPFDRIWLEPLVLAAILCLVLTFTIYDVVAAILMAFAVSLLSIAVVLSVVRRAKAGELYKTTFLCLLMRFFVLIARHVNIALRVGGIVIIYLLIQLLLTTLLAHSPSFQALIVWLFSSAAVVALCVLAAIQYDRLKKATDRMAAGELGQVVDENKVALFSRMARNLNSTGKALNLAVERATSSERMKTELITNVSHDIKTPLTSIISYVGLLKTTDIQDPKAQEYIDVLERKSKRLAQLMADLVEASKVTSGNVTVEMEPLNLGELVKQAGGEFESRLEERGITLMCHLPEQPVMVMADGRHLWRVLDNLFGNTVKYALDGTRVYVDVADLAGEAILSMKNISREPLNIRPDELMERFVRGDQARNTEGSGLGLSIARSLMELQDGSMDIQIDGDLFKVILCLKKVPPEMTA